jgi:hypothetical protein
VYRDATLTREQINSLIEFTNVVTAEHGATAEQVVRICRYALLLHGFDEAIQDVAAARNDATAGARAGLKHIILEITQAWGCSVLFTGNPKDYAVKLELPSGRSNSWGGDYWCVPEV